MMNKMNVLGRDFIQIPWKVRKSITSYTQELFRENRDSLQIYLDESWDPRDHQSIINDFKDNPYEALIIVEDYIRNRRDPQTNRDTMIKLINKPESGVILVSGSKGSGKSYFAFDLIQEMSSQHRPVWIGPPISLPDWIHYSPDLNGLRKGDLAVIDEAANALNARRAMTQKNVSTMERIPTLRHAGIKVIAITQSTKRMDIYLVEFADIHIKKEYTALYAERTERFGVDMFDKYMNIGKKEWNLIKSAHFTGMVLGRTLEWYDDSIGKPYSLFENRDQGILFLSSMIDEGLDSYTISSEMNMRGCGKSKKEWEAIIEQYETHGTFSNKQSIDLMDSAGVANPGAHLTK